MGSPAVAQPTGADMLKLPGRRAGSNCGSKPFSSPRRGRRRRGCVFAPILAVRGLEKGGREGGSVGNGGVRAETRDLETPYRRSQDEHAGTSVVAHCVRGPVPPSTSGTTPELSHIITQWTGPGDGRERLCPRPGGGGGVQSRNTVIASLSASVESAERAMRTLRHLTASSTAQLGASGGVR